MEPILILILFFIFLLFSSTQTLYFCLSDFTRDSQYLWNDWNLLNGPFSFNFRSTRFSIRWLSKFGIEHAVLESLSRKEKRNFHRPSATDSPDFLQINMISHVATRRASIVVLRLQSSESQALESCHFFFSRKRKKRRRKGKEEERNGDETNGGERGEMELHGDTEHVHYHAN